MYGNSRSPRAGLILLGVVIFLLIGAVALYFILSLNGAATNNQANTQNTSQAAPPQQVSTIKIIVAAHDIHRGARLTEDDVTTMDWPSSPDTPLPPDALTVGNTPDQPGLEQVKDRVARVDILQNQPILGNMLTPGDKPPSLGAVGSDAALLIPPGKIAISVPISRMSSVSYKVRPGDHVDVLMSYRFIDLDKDFQTKLPNGITAFDGGTGFTQSPNASTGAGIDTQGREENGPFGLRVLVVPSELDQHPRQSTQIMITNAEVLAVGDTDATEGAIVVTPETSSSATGTPEPANQQGPTAVPPAPDIITLIVSRQDALVLKYSLEVGADIDLGLRSAYDVEAQDTQTDTVTLQYLFDYYKLEEPPKLPLGFDPSIDVIVNPVGNFQQSVHTAPPADNTPAP